MNGAASGLLMLVLAGVVNPSFTLAMKYARRQARENTQLARTVLSDIVIAVRPGAAAQCGLRRYPTWCADSLSGSYAGCARNPGCALRVGENAAPLCGISLFE